MNMTGGGKGKEQPTDALCGRALCMARMPARQCHGAEGFKPSRPLGYG
ncbi:MAG: hypothetical protein ACMUIL_01100 [bacterium]